MRIFVQLAITLVVFVGSVVLCAAGGGLIAMFIAAVYPSYYPAVFASASRPEIDPVHVGIGTGIGQGAGAGVFVGAVVVLALAIANARRNGRQL